MISWLTTSDAFPGRRDAYSGHERATACDTRFSGLRADRDHLVLATVGALNMKLWPKQIEHLDQASAIPMGTPHEQINGSAVTIAGGKPELLQVPVIPVA